LRKSYTTIRDSILDPRSIRRVVGNVVYFLQDSLGEILEENGAMLEWVSEFLRGLGSRRAKCPRKEARLHRFVCINFIC